METLSRRRQLPIEATGKRALALCAACPLAEVCAIKPAEECLQISLDDCGGAEEPLLPEQRRSYRELLMDDSVPTIMAQPKILPKKPEVKKPIPAPVQPRKQAIPRPPVIERPKDRPLKKGARIGEVIGDAIADIFASMISVRGVATVAKSKKGST